MHDGLWLWTYDMGFVYIGDITSLKALSLKKDTGLPGSCFWLSRHGQFLHDFHLVLTPNKSQT